MTSKQVKPFRKTIYLIRHGDCRQDDVKRYIGQIDLPLNQMGVRQALSLAHAMMDIPLDRIYCSDLRRSYDMARIISGERHTVICQKPELREINLGMWDGLAIEEICKCYPEEYKKRGADLVRFRPPGGESFHDLAARIIPLFNDFLEASGEHILIVGHAGVNRIILCHILDIPMANIFHLQQEYGGVNILERSSSGLRLSRMNISCFSHCRNSREI